MPESELPPGLRGIRATVDGEEVPIRITGYWLPEGREETILDFEIPQAKPKPGNQVLEILDSSGKVLGGAIIQLEADRIRVHDVSPWTTAMLKLARRNAAQGGTSIQNLRPAEIQRMGLAPEMANPLAYLAEEEEDS